MNLQFAPAEQGQKVAGKRPAPKGNFVDSWTYLGMDEYVSDEAKVIRDRCRVFAERYNPEMYAYTESSNFPHHLIPEFAKLGMCGADFPKSIGGKGMSCPDVGSMFFELAKKDASLATFMILHHSLGQYTVYKLAQPALRDMILKETMSLKKVLAWALTEPETGSDASNIKTTARKVEGGYVLNGRKRWIGNATFADFIACWARNESDGGRVQCFLVRKGNRGLTTGKIEHKMSLRAVQNADIILRDYFVPDGERFELAADFASGTKEILQHSRIFVAWLAVGMAAGACEAAFKYTKERVQFGKPIAAK